MSATAPEIPPLTLGSYSFGSRLLVGTGKYFQADGSTPDYALMKDCLALSGTEVVTVAVRRVQLDGEPGAPSLLDFLDPDRLTILPNTAGCFCAEDAVRTAELAREALGVTWVKLEVLADPDTLLPEPLETLEAAKQCVARGFTVLCYTSDDPVMARRLEEVGVASVMPAGSPIGSGQGVLNANSLAIILERANVPVIVDAGVGTASDVTLAMELGAAGVLLNTGIAGAEDPRRMAVAMGHAWIAGWHAARAGRIPKKRYATATSPIDGAIGARGS